MTLLYRPLGLLFSVLGGLIAGAAFKRLWRFVAGQDKAPDPLEKGNRLSDVLLAAAAEGAVFGLVKAAIDRGSARGFEQVTGVWPGEE